MLNKSKGKEGNYIDADVFPNNPKWAWSATSVPRSSSNVWVVYFDNGKKLLYGKGNSNYIRLVRNREQVAQME